MMCIRRVTSPKPNAENATPFHDDSSEDHWRNFKAANKTTQAQDMTTCIHNEIDCWPGKNVYYFMQRDMIVTLTFSSEHSFYYMKIRYTTLIGGLWFTENFNPRINLMCAFLLHTLHIKSYSYFFPKTIRNQQTPSLTFYLMNLS